MSSQERLSTYIDAHFTDLVAFCQRLIQTPSVNGLHPERALAEVIAAEAKKLGLTVEFVSQEDDHPNVIVSTSEQGDVGLLLVGHLDTVGIGDEREWKFPPFSGTLSAGRIYGRGAVDTKGGMAVSLYALAALKHTGLLQHGRAQFIGVPDEETGATGTLGIKVLIREGKLAAKGAIYAYSGDEINIGHRGLLRYEITALGTTAHSGTNEWQDRKKGKNAVTALSRLLIALENLDQEMAYSKIPLFAPYRTVITPTMIAGGAGINIVPDRATAFIDIRLTPEYQRAILEPQLFALGQGITEQTGCDFEWKLLNEVPAVMSDENAQIFKVLEQVIPQVKGHSAPRTIAGPANEGYLLIEHGIPMVCGLGPQGDGAHSANEYVEVQGLRDATLVYALTALGLDEE